MEHSPVLLHVFPMIPVSPIRDSFSTHIFTYHDRTSSISPYISCQHAHLRVHKISLTMGSTNLTPLSSGGLWLAVIITPIVCPFNFLERRAASKPTRKTTESRRLLDQQTESVSTPQLISPSQWIREGEAGGYYPRFHAELGQKHISPIRQYLFFKNSRQLSHTERYIPAALETWPKLC